MHSSILAWKIPWTEELGGLQSMGLQRVRRDWVTKPPLLATSQGKSKTAGKQPEARRRWGRIPCMFHQHYFYFPILMSLVWTCLMRVICSWKPCLYVRSAIKLSLKHVYYHMWNRLPVQVQRMRQGAQGWCTGMTLREGMGWEERWEGGSEWGKHVHSWLIQINVWQKPLQYCKVISLKLKLIN